MKKLAVLALIGALSMSSAFVVSADETEAETTAADETLTLTLDMVDADVYEGTWVSFVAGFDLYLPSDWDVRDVENDEEAAEAGIAFQATAPDESGWSVAVLYYSAEDLGAEATLEDVYAQFSEEDSGYTSVYNAVINDIPVVTYDYEEQDVSGFAFVGDQGGLYSVMLTPLSDEDFSATATNIICSFSLTEEVEASSEAATEAE